jgi:hypothetical protein
MSAQALALLCRIKLARAERRLRRFVRAVGLSKVEVAGRLGGSRPAVGTRRSLLIDKFRYMVGPYLDPPAGEPIHGTSPFRRSSSASLSLPRCRCGGSRQSRRFAAGAYAQAWVAVPSEDRWFVDLDESATSVSRFGHTLTIIIPPPKSATSRCRSTSSSSPPLTSTGSG